MRSGNPGSTTVLYRKVSNILTAEKHRACAGPISASQHIEQRCFASAVRANDPNGLLLAEMEIDLIQDDEGPEALVD